MSFKAKVSVSASKNSSREANHRGFAGWRGSGTDLEIVEGRSGDGVEDEGVNGDLQRVVHTDLWNRINQHLVQSCSGIEPFVCAPWEMLWRTL